MLFYTCLTGFSQSYNNETLPRQMTCSCRDKMMFGMSLGSFTSRPFNKYGNCPHYIVPAPVFSGYEGFYLFKKRHKKQSQVCYPRKSHIIRF